MKSRPLVALLCLTLAPALTKRYRSLVLKAWTVILLLWHGLSWEDIQGMQLDGPAAWAWLNTAPLAGGLTAAYLSIGAGARANGLAVLPPSTKGSRDTSYLAAIPVWSLVP